MKTWSAITEQNPPSLAAAPDETQGRSAPPALKLQNPQTRRLIPARLFCAEDLSILLMALNPVSELFVSTPQVYLIGLGVTQKNYLIIYFMRAYCLRDMFYGIIVSNICYQYQMLIIIRSVIICLTQLHTPTRSKSS